MTDPRVDQTKAPDPWSSRARRGRNIAIAVALFAFVVLIFCVTIAKLAGNVGHG